MELVEKSGERNSGVVFKELYAITNDLLTIKAYLAEIKNITEFPKEEIKMVNAASPVREYREGTLMHELRHAKDELSQISKVVKDVTLLLREELGEIKLR